MKNQTQATLPTNPGTSKTSESINERKVDEGFETWKEFEARVNEAKFSNEDALEAGMEIFKFQFGPKALENQSFWYNGVRVFQKGLKDKILAEESIGLGQRMHGDVGTVEGIT